MAQCLGQEFDIHERIKRIVEKTAEASGAVADVTIVPSVPVTYNDPVLSERMAPTLQGVARNGNVVVTNPSTTAEDFSFFRQKIPGFYFNLGVTPDGTDPATAPTNHSPYFYADEGALPVGVRAMAHLAVDFLTMQKADRMNKTSQD